MDGDYYGYGPRKTLERPVALVGFLGAPVAPVAQAMAALSGHPFLDVDRGVEHQAGASLAEQTLRDGEAAVRRLEATVVHSALRSEPSPIIALGHGALLDRAIRQQIAERALLVYLRLPFDDLVQILARGVARRPALHFEWLGGEPPDPRQLEPLFEARRPGYEAADVVIDVGERHSRTVARELVRRFDLA